MPNAPNHEPKSAIPLPETYHVEVNANGITEGIPGDWTLFSIHHSLIDALRGASNLLEAARAVIAEDHPGPTPDHLIEPWLRIMDQRDNTFVAWVDNGQLRLERELPAAPPAEADVPTVPPCGLTGSV